MAEVENRLKEFLGKRLDQTGKRPPVKVLCDKATWKHNSRMVSGVTTFVPDSDTPIQAFYTGSEICPSSTGVAKTKSLMDTFNNFIIGDQYQGISADQYTLHCNAGSMTYVKLI